MSRISTLTGTGKDFEALCSSMRLRDLSIPETPNWCNTTTELIPKNRGRICGTHIGKTLGRVSVLRGTSRAMVAPPFALLTVSTSKSTVLFTGSGPHNNSHLGVQRHVWFRRQAGWMIHGLGFPVGIRIRFS